MHLFRSTLVLFCGLLLIAPGARAAPPDPLHVIPEQAHLVLKVDQPRPLVESITSLDLFKQLQAFPPVREFYDTGNFRRFFDILYYFERELGANRLEMLDRLAGNGVVFAVRFGEPTVALLVIQGKDEALLKKFHATALRLLESEQARLEGKEEIKKGTYRDAESVRIARNLYAATAGTTLLVSNHSKGLQAGLDQYFDPKRSAADNPKVIAARRLLPPDPLVWGYLDLDVIRQAPQLKPLFAMPSDNPAVPLFLGGYVDVARRAPFITAGLYHRPTGFQATVRLPRGREGMAAEVAAHIPPADQPGSRPLLRPKGVLFSTSYYFDLAKIWEHRTKLLNEQVVAFTEGLDKGLARFPGGATVGKILGMIGPYQRLVVAAQEKPGYKIQPAQQLPAFGFVVEMRDPKSLKPLVDLAIRGGVLQASRAVKLQSVEEKVGEHKLVGYRFPEDAKLEQDVSNLRFNFSPCFAFVGNQLLLCSTLELGRELVGALDREARGGAEQLARPRNAASGRTLLSGAGGAVILKNLEEQLFVQAMLERALTPEAARKQVQALIELLHQAGSLHLEATYGAEEFRYDFELKLGR